VHANFPKAKPELGERESLGEEISHHFLSGDVRENNVPPQNRIPQSMVNHNNVLSGRADCTMIKE
jgi:hypothetical protein